VRFIRLGNSEHGQVARAIRGTVVSRVAHGAVTRDIAKPVTFMHMKTH